MVRRIRPVTFVWDGNHMVPMPRFRRECQEQFVVNEEYPLTILEARSRRSHNHFFACVHEAWMNLPDEERYITDPITGELRERFASEDHLRKHALVKAGFYDEKNFVCETPGHAMNLAAFVRSVDTYAVISVRGNVVLIYEAKSQSAAAMGREMFQASKDAVLDVLSEMIRAKPADLRKEGAKHFPEPRRQIAGPEQ
jgi:hypothetical protein